MQCTFIMSHHLFVVYSENNRLLKLSSLLKQKSIFRTLKAAVSSSKQYLALTEEQLSEISRYTSIKELEETSGMAIITRSGEDLDRCSRIDTVVGFGDGEDTVYHTKTDIWFYHDECDHFYSSLEYHSLALFCVQSHFPASVHKRAFEGLDLSNHQLKDTCYGTYSSLDYTGCLFARRAAKHRDRAF